MTGNGIKFDKDKISSYFINGLLGYTDNGSKVDFSNEVVFDTDQRFWKQNCIRYEPVDEIEVLNNFKNYFDEYDRHNIIKSGIKGMVLEAYRQFGREKFHKLRQIPDNCIVFSNAIVYVGTKNPKEILEPENVVDDKFIEKGYISASFNYFITNPISYEYNPTAVLEYPNLKRIMIEWVGEKQIDMLIESIAYAMLPNNPFELGFMFKGKGANGKTCCSKLIEKIIGKENCTATNLYNLTESNFGTAQLFKKLVAFIGEADGHRIDKTSILKAITGNDPIPAEFKNKPNFHFKNYATIFINTNTVPQTNDKTDGWYRRWIIIDFPNQFTEHKDIFADIPESEYEALANDCIIRLKKILKQGKLTNEPSIKEKAERYERESNPLFSFFTNNYEITESIDDHIFVYELYNDYMNFCDKQGYSKNATLRSVSSDIQSFNITTERRVNYNKDGNPRHFAFIGIKKKDKIVNPDEPPIEPEKEYTKQEIFDYFVNLGKIPKEKYDIDEAIRILKTKTQDIYEPRNGVYKINKGNNYGQSMDN